VPASSHPFCDNPEGCKVCRPRVAAELAPHGYHDLRERYAAFTEPGYAVRYRWSQGEWDGGEVVPVTEEIAYLLSPAAQVLTRKALVVQQKAAEATRVQRVGADAQEAMARLQRLAQQAETEGPGEGVRMMRAAAERQESADRALRLVASAARAGVPARICDLLRGDGLERYDRDRAGPKAVREWYKGKSPALLLCGGNQVGKSVAAAAWLAAQEGGRWCWSRDVEDAVQPDPEDRGRTWLRAVQRATALVYDDAKHLRGTEAIEQTEALLQRMLDNGRRLIVTANGDAADFFRLFGDGKANRIYSRWQKVGGEIKEVRA